MLSESLGKGVFGKPDQAMLVGGQHRRLRMRLGAIEHVGDRFAFVGGERCDVDQRLDFLVAGRGNHRAGIGMADQHDRAFDPLQRPVERGHVVGQRGQRQRRRNDPDAFGPQRADHLAPARSIGPGAMDEHHAHIIEGHFSLLAGSSVNVTYSNDNLEVTI